MNSFSYDEQPDKDAGVAVLIVDDEEEQRDRLEVIIDQNRGLQEITRFKASGLKEAIDVLSKNTVHVVLLDKVFKLPNGSEENGIEVIRDFIQIQPNLQILMISGSDEPENVVEAMRAGACGYVSKEDPIDLTWLQINKAIQTAIVFIQKARLEHSNGRGIGFGPGFGMIGSSKAYRHLTRQLLAVSESNKPVLCEGERGSGKTSAARAVHAYRAKFLKQEDRPWFELNLGALEPIVAERILFGYEKGAFAGAIRTTQGIIELANGGTLFLDNISEIGEDLQGKLLGLLENGTFHRVGGTKELQSSFKLISASNHNLEELVRSGKFRDDLYSIISTLTVKVPGLSERREDIPDIVRAILPRCSQQSNCHVTYDMLPPEFIESLAKYPPPENIKGIEKQICRLLAFSKRDKVGQPIFTKWRSIVDYRKPEHPVSRGFLTVRDVMTLPIHTDSSDFPGLAALLDSVTERLFADLKKRHKKNKDIARILKVSDSSVSMKLKMMNARGGVHAQ